MVAWNSLARESGQSRWTSALGARNHGVDQVVDDQPVGDRPPPSKEQTTVPLGRPAPLEEPSDRFAFMRVRPGSNVPVAYDPCRPIHVAVNTRTAPAEADALLGESLEILNNATGLQFKIDGETPEPPDAKRAPYQPARYPGRWAPVLVAWSDPQEYPGIDGVAGVGGSTPVPVGDHRVYVTGGVTLDGPRLKTLLKHPRGHAYVRAILLHELAHLLGLDHVADPNQLMNSANTGQVSLGPGDLAGLAQLGQGTCYPNV